MKKLLLLTLVLLGGVSSVFADDPTYNIYVKSSNPGGCYIHVWGASEGNTTEYGDKLLTLSTTILNGTTYYIKTVKGTYSFLCDNGSWGTDNQTSNQSDKTENLYIEYNGGNALTYIQDYINSVNLPGGHNSWNPGSSIFTDNSDNSYTYELTPIATTTEFKLYAFANWKGWNEVTLTPTEWFENSNGNIKLKDIGYSKYTLTATHDAEYNWSLDATVSSNDAYRHTIAGSSAILNGANDWTIYDANDMSDDDLDGVFTLVVRNKHLTAGTYEFKAYRGGNMGGWQVPSYGNNTSITIDAEGYYDITYTLTCRDYTLTAVATTSTVTATVSALGYSTFSCDRALDLDNASAGLTAYKASVSDGKVVLTKVTGTVAAETGLLLAGTTGTIPVVVSGTDISESNLLKACVNGGTITKSGTDGKYHYFLAGTTEENIGFYNLATDTECAAGKAYLETTEALATEGTGGARASWVFQDEEQETDGIQTAKAVTYNDNVYYDLQGRKVAYPTKGLYIINGKKVVVK